MPRFSEQEKSHLLSHLQRLQGRGVVLSYYQLQGLLMAVTCSPERLQRSDWIDLVWLSEAPKGEPDGEVSHFHQLIDLLADVVNERAAAGRLLPFEEISELRLQELAEWCDGFITGHHYLEDIWMLALDELDEDALFATIGETVALTYRLSDLDGLYQLGWDDDEEGLPTLYRRLGEVLKEYYAVHHEWQGSAWPPNMQKVFERMEPIPAERPCPCGSGETFARCCLH